MAISPLAEPAAPPPPIILLLSQTDLNGLLLSSSILAFEELPDIWEQSSEVSPQRSSPQRSRYHPYRRSASPSHPSYRESSTTAFSVQEEAADDPPPVTSSDKSSDPSSNSAGNAAATLSTTTASAPQPHRVIFANYERRSHPSRVHSPGPPPTNTVFIPAPKGGFSRPDSGGYNVEEALNWSKPFLSRFKTRMEILTRDLLDSSCSFTEQDQEKTSEFITKMMAEFPELTKYERVKARGSELWSWPLKALLMAHLKYKVSQTRRRAAVEAMDAVEALANSGRKKKA